MDDSWVLTPLWANCQWELKESLECNKTWPLVTAFVSMEQHLKKGISSLDPLTAAALSKGFVLIGLKNTTNTFPLSWNESFYFSVKNLGLFSVAKLLWGLLEHYNTPTLFTQASICLN